jgi:hypothetical protein
MPPFRPQRRVFRRGDNVLAYWIDHADGFEVWCAGRLLARIDAVVIDPRRGRATALIARSAHLQRRRVIPVETVVAVEPFARRLEVERAGPSSVTRASRFVALLIASGVTGIIRLVGWSAPRFREAAGRAYLSVRRAAPGAAAAWTWFEPRLRQVAVGAWVLGSGIALRLGGALGAWTRSSAAWLGPRLSSRSRSVCAHTATGARKLEVRAGAAAAQLGPRLSSLARTVLTQVVAFGQLCLIAGVAAAAWLAPRVRAAVQAAARAALVFGVAAARGVHLVGIRFSQHARYVATLRRD